MGLDISWVAIKIQECVSDAHELGHALHFKHDSENDEIVKPRGIGRTGHDLKLCPGKCCPT